MRVVVGFTRCQVTHNCRYLLRLRRYKRRTRPPTTTRVTALSCHIKISAVRRLVLSQSMCVTDRRTDKITTVCNLPFW